MVAFTYSNLFTLKADLRLLDKRIQSVLSDDKGIDNVEEKIILSGVSRSLKKQAEDYSLYVSLLILSIVICLIGLALSQSISVILKVAISFIIIIITFYGLLTGSIS